MFTCVDFYHFYTEIGYQQKRKDGVIRFVSFQKS